MVFKAKDMKKDKMKEKKKKKEKGMMC